MKIAASVTALVPLMALFFACAPQKGPQVASSAGQVGYAKGVPGAVEAHAARHEADLQRANDILETSFGEFLGSLEETDWERVGEVYEMAQDEGRGSAYSAHREEAQTVLSFYESEKKKLVGRVAGANKRKAKEQGCDVDLYGTTDWALQKSMMERLVERRREASDAHAEIHREKKVLGRKNEDLLVKQVDEIMFASYMAHVGAEAQALELQDLVDESSDARKAIEGSLEELQKQEKPDEKEIEELSLALDALSPALEHAKERLKNAEEDQKALQEKYDKAWAALLDELKDRDSKAKVATKSDEPQASR